MKKFTLKKIMIVGKVENTSTHSQSLIGNVKIRRDMIKYILMLQLALLSIKSYAQMVPTITSFSPTSGTVGTSVTLFGSNFDTSPANNTVYFGATKATVSSASSSELIVTVPPGATYQPITVAINGLVAESAQPFKVTFESDGTIAQSMFDSSLFFDAGLPAYKSFPADLDGDGLSDLVMAGGEDYSILVFQNISLGVGEINFDTEKYFFTTGNTVDVSLADFDGDGKLDMVASYDNFPVISVFRNISGSILGFDTRQDFSIPGYSVSSGAGDMDGDGKMDLAIVDKDNDSIYILMNTSTGIGSIDFNLSNNLFTGDGPVSIEISDIDQDQLPDLVVTSSNDSTLSVFLNTGSNTFSAKQDFSLTSDPGNIVIGDVDGDGIVDIGVPSSGITNPMIRLFRNNSSPGSLSFTSHDITDVNPQWMDFDDINGDGKTDIMCTNINEDNLVIFKNTSTIGSFSFDPKVSKHLEDVSPNSVFSGDLDNNSEPDVMVSGLSNSTYLGRVEILRNLGSGNSFISFSFDEQKAPATIDSVNHTIDINLEDCTDPTALVATFTLSPGATAAIPGGMGAMPVFSGITSYNYTDPVYFLVTSEDGKNQIWSVTVNANSYADNVTVFKEECENYLFDGNLLTTSGTYYATFTNQIGCDSLVTLHLTILEPSTGTDVIAVNDSLTWIDGITYTESNNTATYTLTNIHGCDSVVTLNLTILGSSTGNSFTSFSFAEQSAPATIDTVNHTIDIDLMDCTDPTALIASFTLSPDATAAIPGGMGAMPVYSGVTSYDYTNPVAFLVTSGQNVNQIWIVTVHANSFADNVIVTKDACSSYTFDGNVLTTSGVYQATFTNQHGCDSLVTLYLAIWEPSTGADVITASGSYTWIDGITYIESNDTATYTLTNQHGCDSVVTLNLTIIDTTLTGNSFTSFSFAEQSAPATIDTVNHTIDIDLVDCTDPAALVATFTLSPGATVAIPGGMGAEPVYSGITTYNYTDPVVFHVTSETNIIAEWTVTAHANSFADNVIVTKDACSSYTFDGNVLTTSGTYQATFTNQLGCDSLVTLYLTILEPSTGTDVISACESYTWIDGVTYSESNNTAIFTLTNSVGCDSVVTLNLTIGNPDSVDADILACSSYEFDGNVLTTSGQYKATLTNQFGCDSVVTLNLTILEPSTGTDVITTCESYTWIDGVIYTENNYTATYTLTNAVGCDSIVTLDLTFADTCTSTSVYGISDNDILVYPNPVHDHLVVELPSEDFSKIEILDITGKQILTKEVEGQKIVFSDPDIKNGLYFIRITGKNEQIKTFKIIKK